MSFLRFSHQAMATTFEVVFPPGPAKHSAEYYGGVAEALFREINLLEDELSRFRDVSDLARIRALKAGEKAKIGLAAADCLSLAQMVAKEAGGAFDITMAPLLKIWRNQDGTPRQPSTEEESIAGKKCGMNLFAVDTDNLAVTSFCDHLELDLGAIGKGYALDQMAALLPDWGVGSALLNAGDSTVLAVGAPPREEGWIVTLDNVTRDMVSLRDRALSSTGFSVRGNHIMDPRNLRPVPMRKTRTWAAAPTAALSDALSTAFMVMDDGEIEAFRRRFPEVEAIVF